MAKYRYLAADLLSNTIREEIPFGSVNYSKVLDRPGSFSGDLGLDHPKCTRANLNPGATALYVERDGTIVWGGILWTAAAGTSDGKVTFGAEGFHSYARRRTIRVDKTYTAQDQLAIARDLVTYMQSVPGGSVVGGIVVGAETCGITRDRKFYFHERKNLGEALEQLAAVDGGFDFSFDSAWSGNTIVTTFHLYYPRKGSRTGLVLDLRTNLQDIGWNIDATSLANLVDGFGQGEGKKMLIRTAQDVTSLGTYPLLEDSISEKDIKVGSTLSAHARARLASTSTPIETFPTLIARPRADLTIGSFVEGDSIYVKAAGGFLTVDAYLRVISWAVDVDDDGGESISIAFGDVDS